MRSFKTGEWKSYAAAEFYEQINEHIHLTEAEGVSRKPVLPTTAAA